MVSVWFGILGDVLQFGLEMLGDGLQFGLEILGDGFSLRRYDEKAL